MPNLPKTTGTGQAVATGEEYTVAVYALAYGGEGLARHAGMVIFIPGAVPGDQVRVKIREVKPRFARGELLEVTASSEDRCPPFCPLAGRCGGCTWQHLSYPRQLEAKRLFIENSLQHVGHLKGVLVPPTLKASPLTQYRHKIQIPFQQRQGALVSGFYERQSHTIIPMEECPVQPALANRIYRAVRELAAGRRLPGFDPSQPGNQLRHLIIRIGSQTREALVMLVTRFREWPGLEEFAGELQQQIPELVGVVQNINPDATNVILGDEFRSLAGRPFLYEEVRGLKYRISAEAFFQVNPFQLTSLAESVLQAAALTGKETAVDLFCGVGFFTFELARKAKRVVGVESVPASVEDARANLHLNHVSNADFLALDATLGVETLAAKGFVPDVAVMDPPRQGCSPALLQKFRTWKPRRVVYISCNPVTQARDLGILSRLGYQVQTVQPIDLFPHTYHIESVAGLVRK